MGVATSIYGHGEAGAVASEAIRDYKSGRVRSIILIGHSLGGGAVLSIAEQLKYAGVPVTLLISLESVSSGPVASNVRRAVNFYTSRPRQTRAAHLGFAARPQRTTSVE